MKTIQTCMAAGLLLPLSACLLSSASAADEPAQSEKRERRVEVRVESRSSSSSTNGDEPQVKTEGRIVVIGPDGVKKEYDLNAPEGRALILEMEGGLDALKVLEGQAAASSKAAADAEPAKERVMIGVACEEAPQLLRKHLKLDNAGLVVLAVSDNSPAADAKIEPDDVLVSLNERQLQTIEQLMEVVSTLDGQPARLQIIRSGSPLEITVTPRKMTVPDLAPATEESDATALDAPRLPGRNQRFNRLFPGVIIDEQFPADPAAMERMLKKLSSLVREESQHTPDEQLQQLREEIQQLRREVNEIKR
jgi:membrane-associated protease RseP (regulator of RpoE activity)